MVEMKRFGTLDLTDANRTLSQLSYIPTKRLLYYITPTCKKMQEKNPGIC